MKHRKKRRLMVTLFIVLLGGVGMYLYLNRAEPEPEILLNLPTTEEIERMRAIEQAAGQVLPNTQPGTGVRLPGSDIDAESEGTNEVVDGEVGVPEEVVEE